MDSGRIQTPGLDADADSDLELKLYGDHDLDLDPDCASWTQIRGHCAVCIQVRVSVQIRVEPRQWHELRPGCMAHFLCSHMLFIDSQWTFTDIFNCC